METILQFGAGRFLRAFADLFVHQATAAGQSVGRIVVVQSTAGSRADGLRKQGCRYHVAIRGLQDGRKIDAVEEVTSLSRALTAAEDWDAVLDFARSPDLTTILSNTTEAGYALADDLPSAAPPTSFPAKLIQVLKARFDAGLNGVTLLPCELFESNAERLHGVVDEQLKRWGWSGRFRDWLHGACRWRNSLVDRIVSGVPDSHPMLAQDPMLIAAEPYGLWAIEHPDGEPRDPGAFDHVNILRTPDVEPYHLRKVRILNGSHSALVCKAAPLGFKTVREAVEDDRIGPWLEGLMFEEIVPVVAARAADAEAFARQTLERFRNPFLEHKLSDIALHHDTKVQVRLVPTRDEYVKLFGKPPKRLSEIL
jgi:tagaturonate reductase